MDRKTSPKGAVNVKILSHMSAECCNKCLRVLFSLFYLGLGCFGALLCLYKPEWLLSMPLPVGAELMIIRRFAWCISWSCIGFSIVAFFSIKTASGGKCPLPSYIHFYPTFLIVNDLLVLGLLNAFPLSKDALVFYPVAAWACLNLGFWIDNVRFDRLLEAAIAKIK